jgi:hypothetical protein
VAVPDVPVALFWLETALFLAEGAVLTAVLFGAAVAVLLLPEMLPAELFTDELLDKVLLSDAVRFLPLVDEVPRPLLLVVLPA